MTGDAALGRKGLGTADYALECFFAARTFTDATSALHVANVLCRALRPACARLATQSARVLCMGKRRGGHTGSERSFRGCHWSTRSVRVLGKCGRVDRARATTPSSSTSTADRAEAISAEQSIIDVPLRVTITASGLVHVRRLWRVKCYRAAMALDARWYADGSFKTFLAQASAAAGADGLTIADVQCSSALETFEAYLAQSWALEASSLSPEMRHHSWARDIEGQLAARAGGELSPAQSVQHAAAGVASHRSVPCRPHVGADWALPPSRHSLLTYQLLRSLQPTCRQFQASAKYEGIVWVPRILWALEWARRSSSGALTAAEIARVLRDHCQLLVPKENVARAFRDFRRKKIPDTLWGRSQEALRHQRSWMRRAPQHSRRRGRRRPVRNVRFATALVKGCPWPFRGEPRSSTGAEHAPSCSA